MRAAPVNLALIVVLSVLWGVAFLFIKLGLADFSPILFAALRFDIAGPILLAAAIAVSRGGALPRGRKQWSAVLWGAGLNMVAYHTLTYWGQQQTQPAVGAVIVGLNPVLATAFSFALLKTERVGALGAVGLALGIAGIILLEALKGGALFDLKGVGEIAIAAGVSCWALGAVMSRRIDHKLPPAALTAWQMVLAAPALHVMALVAEGGGRAAFTATGTVSLLYLALLSSGLGYFLFFFLVGRVGPIRTTVVSTLTPVSATAAGVVALDDPVEPRMLVAFAMIVTSFALVTEPWKRGGPVKPPEAPASPRQP